MNIAYSILSAAASVESAVGTAEAASADKWEYILSPVQSAETAEAGAEQAADAIARMQAMTETASQSVAQQQLADPEYWSSAGMITLVGLVVVFVILALLILLFWLMGTVFKSMGNKKKAKAEAEKAAAPVSAPVPVEEAEEESPENDDEIMAVISAAVAAYAEEDGASYTIRDVRRRDTRSRSAWSLAGISENTRPF